MNAHSHPEELLDAWRAGELGADDEAKLRAHADTCVACRLELGVEAGLDAQTRLDREDETKMAAMIGAALVELVELPELPEAPTAGSPAPAKAGASKLLIAGAGLAGGIVVALVLGGRGDPPTADAASPAPELTAPPVVEAPEDGPRPPHEAAPTSPRDDAPALDETETEPKTEPESEAETGPDNGSASSVPDAASLLREANAQRRAHRYPQAARIYERLAKHHRGTDEEILARVTYAKMLTDHLDRPADALRRFDAYLAARPRGTLAEEALAGRAKALGRLGRSAEERAAWRTLLARFPDSVYADLARRHGGG